MPGADRLDVAIDRKRFGERQILANIHFAATPGEFLALLAPSGTGKTTALRIVLGVDHAFSGEIHRPPGRIGAMFQDPRLLPWLTVADNLRLVAPTLTEPALHALLDMTDLRAAEFLLPKQLSLGMSRRVALARALAVQPSLLILDEPFASLDPLLAASLSRSVADHARRIGAITIMATHDLNQALAIADRILVLEGNTPAALAADLPAASANAADIRTRFSFLTGDPKAAVLF